MRMVIVIMGVSGVGKTTVGQALAQDLGWLFADADDLHPAANVAKMRAGIPLDDGDRAPWLRTLRGLIESWLATNQSAVLACSALKESYRIELLVNRDAKLVYLHADLDQIAERTATRTGHYMNPDLLKSQFDTLEPPRDAVSIDAAQSVPEIVAQIRSALDI